jgi:hypothetical protein
MSSIQCLDLASSVLFQVYVGILATFVSIDGRDELPTVMF